MYLFFLFQIVAAISWPVEIPDRKFFITMGFQFNYDLPFDLATFYKPPRIALGREIKDSSIPNNRTDVELNHFNKTKRSTKHDEVSTTTEKDLKLKVEKYCKDEEHRSKRDMSAGELYTSFEQTFIEYVLYVFEHFIYNYVHVIF